MALNPLDRLVRDMEDVKRQLAGRSQINHSSLENTAIPVYDGDGTERLRIGAQDDGTHAVVYVQGPPPPRPTAPIVSVDGPVVRVRWDGELMGGHIPEDFARIDVHFALASDDLEDPAAVRANLATAAGSEATLMATQTGTYRVGLVAMSQSRARSEMSETVEVEVQVVDLATAIETAVDSANGKNKVTYSVRSPEPTDEGAAGDTWWVNEVRPRDPEDPASGLVVALIEQWRHTGDFWAPVEMAHEVIASVDLGRATVGLLWGGRIEAGSIETEQLAFGAATGDILAVDALNFKRGVGLDLVSSSFRAGDAVEITEEYGFRQFGPDGALNVDFPSDGSPASVRGDFSARRLSAQQMQLTGATTIASGADVVIESGVTAPAAAPQVTPYWGRTTMPPLTDREQAVGIAWGEGHWWRLVTTSVPLAEGGRTRIEKISPDGQLVDTITGAYRTNANGITYLNGELYVLAAALSVSGDGTTPVRPRMVVVYGTGGVERRRWEYAYYGSGTYEPGIGTNGTDIITGQCLASSGELRIRRFSPTGALLETLDTGRPIRSDIGGVYIGPADFGTQKLVVAKRFERDTSLKQVTTYDMPGSTYRDDLSWHTPNRESPHALAWDGVNFWTMTGEGNLVRYSRREGSAKVVGDDSPDWWLAASWRDSPAESMVGPAQRFTWPHRSELLVTVPDIPQGVTGVAFFAARQTSEPVRTDLHWAAEINQAARTVIVPYLPSNWGGLRPPVGESSFTDREPGELRSSMGGFRVDGSGAGEWGPLTFHADGTMTGPYAHGTVVVTPVANTSTALEVTLPSGRFSSPPTVVATLQTGNLNSAQNVGVNYQRTTKDSFEVVLLRNNTVGTSINWIAIGE